MMMNAISVTYHIMGIRASADSLRRRERQKNLRNNNTLLQPM